MHDGADWPYGESRSFAPIGVQVESPGRRPIFLHGMWRSGSTFLWSRFRTDPNTLCFYEPLHHGLAKLTHARIERDSPQQIDANRHPALSTPYFAEFRPLIDRRGVRDYHPSLAYDRFVLNSGDAHPRLERYISNLVNHADREGRTAVLGFNRTGLRLAWLRARFDAFNVHIDRDPMAIWASYSAEAANGNYAFFSMWLTILEKNAAHPLFAPLAERLNLGLSMVNLLNSKSRRRQIIQDWSDEERYFLIFYLWLACNGHALTECDLVIDTQLADVAHYRRQITDRIASATGIRIDLGAMRVAEPRMALSPTIQHRIERSAMEVFPRAALPNTRLYGQKFTDARARKSGYFAAAF